MKRSEHLRRGRVLIVGIGALGGPAALALTRSGVGTLGVIDGDSIEISNLHRQVLYREEDVGKLKVDAIANHLGNSDFVTRIECYPFFLSSENCDEIFPRYDFIIDGCDDPKTKYLINDCAIAHGRPFSHAGVRGLIGQTLSVSPGKSACLRCVFPDPPDDSTGQGCHQAGILGPVAGAFGTIQASEAIRYLIGEEKMLTDRLLSYDGAKSRWNEIRLQPQPRCSCRNIEISEAGLHTAT